MSNDLPPEIQLVKDKAIQGVSNTISKIVDATFNAATSDSLVQSLLIKIHQLEERSAYLESQLCLLRTPVVHTHNNTVKHDEQLSVEPVVNHVLSEESQVSNTEQQSTHVDSDILRFFGGHPMTHEQDTAVEESKKDESLSIDAFAGSGKTTLLNAISRLAKINKRVLYIAYNRAIADHAKRVFPSNVSCMTTHSLAYREIIGGGGYDRSRLCGNISGYKVAKEFGINHDVCSLSAISLCNYALDIVSNFCNSSSQSIGKKHYRSPMLEGIKSKEILRQINRAGCDLARLIWREASNRDSDFPITHDYYLKIWLLTNPDLSSYDTILVDEAQDTNDALIQVLERQDCNLIWVGDRFQAIYGWRGAKNALSKVRTTNSCQITQSFRFGEAIGELASSVLSYGYKKQITVRGFDKIDSQLVKLEHPSAVITRTNATLMGKVLEYIASNPTKKVAIEGGVSVLARLMEGAQALIDGRRTNVSELAAFETWAQVVEFSETQTGQGLKSLVRLSKSYNLRDAVKQLDGVNMVDNQDDADIVFTTAHKSKGKEFDSVLLADDFRIIDDEDPKLEEVNLLYVALTRAKKALDVGSCEALLQILPINRRKELLAQA